MEHKKVDHLATLGFLDSRVMDTSDLVNMMTILLAMEMLLS